jgi:hypothetical protein
MTVYSLTTYVWNGADVFEETVFHPPCAVEQAIRALEGQERNDLYLQLLENDPETWLAVGGGSLGYVVNGSIANERFPALVLRDSPSEPSVRLVVGGQEGDWPCNQVVPLAQALDAALRVHTTGSFECGIEWQYV